MDWFAQITTFGFIAFICFALSILFTALKHHAIGLFLGALEVLPAIVSCSAWADALRSSGKGDWFLLGLLGYPFAALIFYAMLLAGVACIGVNLGFIVKQRTKMNGGS